MSEDLGDFFAAPPFKADEALVALRRQLRELKPLAERAGSTPMRFEWRGLPALEIALADSGPPALKVALARKLSSRPDWARATLTSSAEVRKWVDEVKRAMKRWDDED